MIARIAATCLILAFAPPAPGAEVPESIAADGVPAVPDDVSQMLARYQGGRSAAFQDWAPGGGVLFLTRDVETNQLYQVGTRGGKRIQVTKFPERVGSAAARPGRDEVLVTTDEGGNENEQLVLVDTKAGTSRRLTDGKSRNLAPRWSNSGKLLAWAGNARNGKDMDLYLIDPEAGPARIIKEVAGSWAVADWSPDDRKLAVVETISANESYVHVVDVADGRTAAINARPQGRARPVVREDVRFSKDGASLYWTTDDVGEFLHLFRHDLATGQETNLTPLLHWDVEDYDLADDGRTIALVANEDGLAAIHVIDAVTGQDRPGPRLPAAGQVGGLRFRKGSREVAFSFGSARSPADVYSCNLDDNVLRRWTTSDPGGVDPSKFAEPELIHFPTFDGRLIPAFVYRPSKPSSGPRPVLIDIHGGPEGQFRPGYLGRANALIEELGIVLIYPNVRGSSGYGKAFLMLDNGRLREDSVKDIGALLDWVERQPDLDRTRVAVQGGSYGGYMALATMTHYNDRLKAGIDVVGISNFVTFLNNTQPYRRDLRRVEYGDERDPSMASFLQQISPLNSAEKITRPLLVVQGKNDPRVPATESEQVVARVRKGGGPVWYVVGKNEGHGFARKPNQDYQQAVQVMFLRQYLVGAAGP